MNLKTFFTKGWPTRLAFYLGKYLPYGGGLFSGVAARLVVTFKPDMYYAVQSNLRHVVGPDLPERELDWLVYRMFFNAVRGYYELFHNVGRGVVRVENFRPLVRMTPEARIYMRQGLDAGRGLFILGTHMSNFDLAGIGMTQFIPSPVQVLSLADPPPGFEIFNRLREKGHGVITPISPQALRDAMQRLKDGGVVLTGVDHPIGEGDEPVEFFGVTAHLPTGYIRIPLMTDCLVMTISFLYRDGVYWILANPPMDMVRTGDRRRDREVNLRRVLSQVENFIRLAPDQWLVFIPVWEPI